MSSRIEQIIEEIEEYIDSCKISASVNNEDYCKQKIRLMSFLGELRMKNSG